MISLLICLLGQYCFGQHVEHEHGSYKMFENKGQWPDQVLFRADAHGGKLWFEEEGILYQFLDYSDIKHADFSAETVENPEVREHLVYAHFLGANTSCEKRKFYPTTEYYNYFLGNDESKWASDVHGYGRIEYLNLYDGIDLAFFEKENELKYEYHIHPAADYKDVKLQYVGHEKIKKLKNGNVVIYSPLGQIIEQKPYVYQIVNGKIIEIESEFELSDSSVLTFVLGDYNKDIELIIDPVLVFATYSGSVTDNFGMTATYAYDGKAYSGGMVFGSAYPSPTLTWSSVSNISVAHTNATTDAFVSKYSEDGTTMLWTNFIGGGDDTQGTETVHSLICDTLNNIYMYGVTSSTDFPTTTAAYQSSHAGGTPLAFSSTGTNFGTQGTDIYTVKISEDGQNLLGGTYIGGTGNDGVNYKITSGTYPSALQYDSLTSNYGDQFRGEIMLDSMNNVYIASHTRSLDFPTVNPIQGANGGQQDGVVFKLSADYTTMIWSTYYGGSENDGCYSVKIDSSYNIIFGGGTSSTNLAGTLGGLNTSYQGGKTDGFIAKLSPDGGTLMQATYIGTNDYDQVFFIEIDRWDNIYCVGQSNGNMPVINAPYSVPNSGQFIMKLLPDVATINYATVFGNGDGDFDISPSAFLVDVCGNVYVSGWGENILQNTDSLKGMPVTLDAFQFEPPNGFDFYLFVMERDAQSLLYGSYLGDVGAGEHVDGGTSRFDKFGIVYQSVCGGCGGSTTFPTTTGAHSEDNLNLVNGGMCNNILFKFDFELVPQADFDLSSIEGCAPFTLVLDNESTDTIHSIWTFPPEAIVLSGGVNPQLLFNDPGTYEIILSITDTICNLQDTAIKIINVYDQLFLNVPNDTIVCDSFTTNLIANSFGSATTFTWASDIGFTDILNTGAMDSIISVSPTETATYYVTASNGWPLCDLVDSVVVQFVDGAIDLVDDVEMCYGDTLMIEAQNLLPAVDISYTWSPPNGIVATQDSIVWLSPTSSQYYYVTGLTSLGCSITDSVWIDVINIDPSTVYVTATPDTIPVGSSTVLQAIPNLASYTYNWYPPIGLSSTNGQTVNATPETSVSYGVVMGDDVCSFTRTVDVVVYEFECGGVYIFVPSAFTPNGDGENDD
ncbi:MAG: hypothetical protein MK066_13725, partial [Crocinitomicaceae bacterium]|nr:hypothetical protein [Crocinitomicaceae bacterium]